MKMSTISKSYLHRQRTASVEKKHKNRVSDMSNLGMVYLFSLLMTYE